ncbi:MAG: group II intron reverse transcriptase/maturase [Clostridia bacterium]|nr:group II intron reverse transcriptase/maturase [Clostridia bacterium]
MANERKDIKYQIEKGYKLQTLMHKVNKETLKEQHVKQQRNKASGIDKITKEEYEKNLEENLDRLISNMKTFSYNPLPVKRVYIPKANGKTRPLGIPAYEDKLVQGVMTEILTEIYENIFLDCSYGFRPNKNCHDVIKYINQTIMTKKVNYIVEADIKGFFDNVDHEWLMKFLEETIADKNFLRYIKRFLKSGYMEEMKYFESEKGTPQGGLISPVLANIYLHYVLDLWIEKYVKPRSKGEVYYARFADDFIVMFQYEEEAKHFLNALDDRFKKFNLELEKTKTRILPFGRFKGTKESFDFLGFAFYNGKTKTGKYRPVIKNSKKKQKQKKENIKKWLHDNMHSPLLEVGENIKKKIIGHYNYFGINGNYLSLLNFYKYIKYTWYKTLRKRGQKNKIKYADFLRIWEYLKIPLPRICVNIW